MAKLLRSLAGTLLGIVVFAGLFHYLVVVNVSQRIEDPEVYNAPIEGTGAYNRIYDEVLVDEAIEDHTGNLLGDLEIEDSGEAVAVLREVMPPAYLKEQTEANIKRFTGYLRHESEDLEIYFELDEPLERIETAVLNKAHQVIDELEIGEPEMEESASSGCSPSAVQRLAAASAEPAARWSQGQLPESAPSLQILDRECREREFDRWFDLLLDAPAMNSQAVLILEVRKEEIREPFVEGDTRAFLKAAAGPLVEPLVEDSVADIRRNLPRNGRFDVLEWIAEESGGLTREDMAEQAESLRGVVSAANGPGRIIALVMVIVGVLLMAAVHLPRPAEMLRWPGITLAMSGGVCLIAGFALNSALPGRIRNAITNAVYHSPGVPVTAMDLAGDLAESLARQATAGFILPAVLVMVIGAPLIVASLLSGPLPGAARRILPARMATGETVRQKG